MHKTRSLKKCLICMLVFILVLSAGCVAAPEEGEDVEEITKTENVMATPRTSWFKEKAEPKISEAAYVSPNALVIGEVEIGEKVYVGPSASIRGDEGTPIYVGAETNVQDGVIMHALLQQYVKVDGKQYAIYVGDKVCCAHGATIHGPCVVGDGSFIGFNAVVFKAEVGKDCAVMHNALVTGGVKIADGRMVPSGAIVDTQAEADALPPVTDDIKKLKAEVVEVNVEFAEGYKEEGETAEEESVPTEGSEETEE